MAGLVLPCAGHPRRDVQCRFKSITPSGAEKRVRVLISACRLTTWIPGTRLHKAGRDADGVGPSPYPSAYGSATAATRAPG